MNGRTPFGNVRGMTVKVVVMYTQPADPASFDEHYFGVHMPLVQALPGLTLLLDLI